MQRIARFRVLMLVLLFGLPTLIFPACGVANESTAYSMETDNAIIYGFSDAIRINLLPEREDYYIQWARSLAFWEVEPTEVGVFHLSIPQESKDGWHTEQWQFRIDADAGTSIAPRNSSALMSALYFFCEGRQDPKLECQGWFDELDAIVEAIETNR